MKHILSPEAIEEIKESIKTTTISIASTTGDRIHPPKKLELIVNTQHGPSHFRISVNDLFIAATENIDAACEIYNSY